MAGRRVYNEIVAEALKKENHTTWFALVRNYLIARDLWEVVDGTLPTPPEHDKENLERWRKKNAAALHVMQISCTLNSLSLILLVSQAKVAWDILSQAYQYTPPQPQPQYPSQATATQVDYDVKALFKAICDNNWQAAKEFVDEHGVSALRAMLTPLDQTALHVAAQYGHVGMVEELLRLVPPEYLEIVDGQSHTPIITATFTGITRIAEFMVHKNSNILSIPTHKMSLPVTWAFINNHKEMRRYLYSVTPLEALKPEKGTQGPRLIRYCFVAGDLEVSLDLLRRCPELLFAGEDLAPIIGIAGMPSAFPSGSKLVFWKRWIYNCLTIQSTTTINNVRVDIQQEGKSKIIQGLGVLHRFISQAYNLLGIKEIYEQKLVHAQAAQILSLVCEGVQDITAKDTRVIVASNALLQAAVCGIVEFVEQVSKANPHLMLLATKGLGWHTFYFAVHNRQPQVFNLFHGFRFKKVLSAAVDDFGNTMLHVAGMLAPSSQLRGISGAALRMQRELQWFKQVESVVSPEMRVSQNKEGKKPDDIFKESHKELRNEGEKWMKETASSCSVVGALVVTIMFAAAFTVPGGNDQESGYPIFLDREKLFMLFIISNALSLFSSSTSVLMFLGILTSRYSEEDFLKSLPRKLIIGLSTLSLSIATMMSAFSATILIMLQHKSESCALLLAIMLASVPVTIFVLLQFPLLAQMISSTYGQGIFKKYVNSWP